MKTRILFALCSVLMCIGTASAQPAPPSPADQAAHRVQMLTQILSLNAQQQTQATQWFTTAATAEANLRTSMEASHTQMETAIEANDATTIASTATQIGDLTAQRIQADAAANAALYAILSPDQQSKFKTMLAHGPGFGGPHGRPGMPPPPPPPQ